VTHWNDVRRDRQRIDPEWKKHWPKFVQRLEKRLRQGHRDYGDKSFARPTFGLLAEVEEELLDQVNWSFIAWTRIHSLRGRLQLLEDKLDEVEMDELLQQQADLGNREGPS